MKQYFCFCVDHSITKHCDVKVLPTLCNDYWRCENVDIRSVTIAAINENNFSYLFRTFLSIAKNFPFIAIRFEYFIQYIETIRFLPFKFYLFHWGTEKDIIALLD